VNIAAGPADEHQYPRVPRDIVSTCPEAFYTWTSREMNTLSRRPGTQRAKQWPANNFIWTDQIY